MNTDKLYILRDQFDALSLRERAIVFFTVLFVAYMVWHQALLVPLQKTQKPLKQQITRLQKNLTLTKAKLGDFSDQAIAQKLERATVRHARLLKQVDVSHQKLKNLDAQIVSTGLLNETIFQKLLTKDARLRLIDLKRATAKSSSRGKGRAGSLAEQSMTLTFEGPYFVWLNYLKKMEALNWQLFWTSLHYQVTEYPDAKITLGLTVPSIDEK